jgi:prepilin-type N-terminal cleavage/methylation domain-containing protein
MHYQHRLTSQRGFTALELIIVLVIGFSIIALSASKMGELFNSSKLARALSSLIELTTTIKTLEGPDGYGPDKEEITKLILTNKMLPKALKTAQDKVKNDWDGELKISLSNGGRGFTIAYPGVPKVVCSKLAKSLLDTTLFTSLKIDSDSDLTQESSSKQIMEACSKNTTSSQSSLLLEVDGSVPTQGNQKSETGTGGQTGTG